MADSRELLVKILGDATSLERAYARSITAGKSYTRTVQLSNTQVEDAAAKNVAALAVQRRELELLAAAYGKMAKAAVAGSAEAAAATKLQRDALARLKIEQTGITGVLSKNVAGVVALGKANAAAAVAIGGLLSVGANAKFEDTLQRIVGLSGVAQENVDEFRKSILDLAGDVGRGPQELAEALFFITSSGVEASKAMGVLKVSAEAAAAGLGETKVVADAVTSVMNAYGANVVDAARATDVLVATVREGKGEAADFAGSIGNVVAFASRIGVSFEDVGAALAAMTQLGTDAETASIQLQQFFSALLTISPQATKAFQSVGLSTAGLRQELKDKGLLATLRTLEDAFKGNTLAARTAFPEIRSFRAILALTGGDAEKTAGVFERLNRSQGSLDQAFGAVKDDDLQRFRQLNAELKAAEVQFGSALAPAVLAFVEPLRKALQAVRDLEDALARLANIKIPTIHIPIVGDVGGGKIGHTIVQASKFAAFPEFFATKEIIDLIRGGGDKANKEVDAAVAKETAKLFDPTKLPLSREALAAAQERLNKVLFPDLKVQPLKGGGDLAPQNIQRQVGITVAQRNAFFDAAIGRSRDLVQDVPTLQGQIGALEKIAGLIQARLVKTKDVTRRLKLEADLRGVFREIAADRKKMVADAHDALVAANETRSALLAVSLQRAGFTGTLKDDIRVGEQVIRDLGSRIKQEGRTAALLGQLAQAQQDQAQRLIEQRSRRQFQAIGLSPTGDAITPTVANLRKQLASLTSRIDTGAPISNKLRTQLAGIRKVLTGELGQTTKQVREKIAELFKTIRDGFNKQTGPLTKTRALDTSKIIQNLELDRDTANQIRSRLSKFNTAGLALGGAPSPAFAGLTGTLHRSDLVPDVFVTVKIDGKDVGAVVEPVVTKSQQTRSIRNPSSRRGRR